MLRTNLKRVYMYKVWTEAIAIVKTDLKIIFKITDREKQDTIKPK